MILTDDEDDNHKQTPLPFQPNKKIRVDLPAPESIPLSQPPRAFNSGFTYFRHGCGEQIVNTPRKYEGAHLIRCRRCGTLINLDYPRCMYCGRAFNTLDSLRDHQPCPEIWDDTHRQTRIASNTRAESGGDAP